MTLDELQSHIVSGKITYGIRRPAPHLRCADGFTLSVQASTLHFCFPRTETGPYTKVELGYPTSMVPEFMEYAEDTLRPTETVYSHVPINLVLDIINRHGGVAP
jgi:hypothetical protein